MQILKASLFLNEYNLMEISISVLFPLCVCHVKYSLTLEENQTGLYLIFLHGSIINDTIQCFR